MFYELTYQLPLQRNDGQLISDELIQAYEKALYLRFGSFTRTRVTGAWQLATGEIVDEPFNRLTFCLDPILNDSDRRDIIQFRDRIRDQFEQEAIFCSLVRIDGDLLIG